MAACGPIGVAANLPVLFDNLVARVSIVGGISRPMSVAVARLITSSSLAEN
jgi:hypothetical protein